MHRDLRGGAIDLTQIVGGQFDLRRGDVLLESMQLRGAGDRHDPPLLRQQPRQRDLRGCRLLPFGELRQPLDKREVRFPILRREARDNVTEIRTVERRVLVDPSEPSPDHSDQPVSRVG